MDPPLLTNPFVSEPVEPADTKGLPPAALGKPQPNEPQEKAYPRSFGKVQRGPGMPRGSDLAIQRTPGTAGMPEPDMNFEGIPSTGVLPPDTNGQVGAEHYVQIVNSGTAGAQVRVWNKETGAQLYDFGLGNLWPPTDPCTLDAYGDPVVLYDQLADRWLLTQFALPDPPCHECIAVSRNSEPTSDPNGWPTTIVPSEIAIARDGEHRMHVYVTVPGTASGGEQDMGAIRAPGSEGHADSVLRTSVPWFTYVPVVMRD